MQLALLIPFLPLLGFLINALFGKRFSKGLVGFVGCAFIFASFALTILTFFSFKENSSAPFIAGAFEWLTIGNSSVGFSFLIDQLSLLMMLVITGVGFLIHLYSIGYMKEDEGYARYFSYLNLFVFFMLLLVMADNYVLMFAGWEGVGFCSYLLIGFWFKNNEYNNAAKKAFIMNRVGDLGFLLGAFLLFITFGSFNFNEIFPQAINHTIGEPVIVAITLLLFIGATGKSAQIPLYTWLPDAMAGPTPVSALIHAATMVTAGIYLIVRSNVLYVLAPSTMLVISIVGALTALLAATIAILQNDIKKVLAYSTVSQLGLIFLALGAGAFTSAMFHLVTHAFFKALLFLGAGSVIHAMSGEQDIRNMGGLKKALPITFITFLIGCIAIAGVPPFSGFFSKDEMLATVFMKNKVLWVCGIIVSALTAFYMFRLLYLTFFNSFRGTPHQQSHLHESPATITIPLVILAILSATAGAIGLPEITHAPHLLKDYLEPVLSLGNIFSHQLHPDHTTELILMGVAVLVAVIAILVARNMYISKKQIPAAQPEGAVQDILFNKYYVDELYEKVILGPIKFISYGFYSIIEFKLIDNTVDLFGKGAIKAGTTIRKIQTGDTGFYIFAIALGITAILFINYLIFVL